MYINELDGLGFGVPGVGDLTSPIMAIASLFQGKPSDFRVWLYFDTHAHYTRQVGDKPNSNTVGMANAIVQAWSQYISQFEASGASYNLPSSFAINIGQRDPSYFYMPDTPHGDPAHGGGTNAKTQIAGPGDPNGALQGLINVLKSYAQGNPNAAASVASNATGSTIVNPATSILPSPGITNPAASQIVSPMQYATPGQYTMPSESWYGSNVPQTTQGGMLSSLSGNLPMMLAIGGFGILAIAMMGSQSAPSIIRTRSAPRVSHKRRK